MLNCSIKSGRRVRARLIDMQKHFAEEKDETDKLQNSEEIKEKESRN